MAESFEFQKIKSGIEAISLNDPPEEKCENSPETQRTYAELIEEIRQVSPSSSTLKFLKNLMSKYTFNLINLYDFKNMYPLEPQFALEVMQEFTSAHADKILHFFIYCEDQIINPSLPKLDDALLSEIFKMTNLEYLLIKHYYFTLDELMELCKNFSNLRRINVIIDSKSSLQTDDSHFVLKFSNSFGQLEVFIFMPTGDLESTDVLNFTSKLVNFGIIRLPFARIVASEFIFIDMTTACMKMEISSNIEFLQIDPINFEIAASKFDKFCELSALVLDWGRMRENNLFRTLSKDHMKLLENCKNLITLTLVDLTHPEILETFLDILGPQLQMLNFASTLDIDLRLVQEKCPFVHSLNISFAGVKEAISFATFTSLRELIIECHPDTSCTADITYILKAPNLECVRLSGFQMTIQQLQDLIALVEIDAILTKIQEIRLILNEKMDSDLKKEIEEKGKEFVSAVKKNKICEARFHSLYF
ncbi:Hypothetical predicted protein [Cloeon dipterum]|uniref:Uncharacterized protein n=1 Tax=Cloeon dipterum TaxID=197152 RepID=A0A8S1D0N8_9INSE|nr:Hypothetical predicted protein [Cloeon dipterum]